MKEKFKNLNLAISCGGTGGHFYPGLTVARELQQQGGNALLFLSGKHKEKYAEIAMAFGVRSVKIDSAPGSRGFFSQLIFLYRMGQGFFKSRRYLKKFKASIMLSMGSFASLPSSLAAKSLFLPLYLHDGNARIGRANRFLSRFAEYLALAFEPVNAEKTHCPWDICGMPLRPEIVDSQEIMTRAEAVSEINNTYNCNFKKENTTILVFGGSQGAEIFNQVFPQAFQALENVNLQVIHLTGDQKYDPVCKLYENAKFPVLVLPSSSYMKIFYLASDAVVSRAGGSTVSEIAFFGKFAFLIPYPYAAENHQYDNALYLAHTGGAVIIDNSECDPDFIKLTLEDFIAKKDDYIRRGRANRHSAYPEATSKLLDYIRAAARKDRKKVIDEGIIF